MSLSTAKRVFLDKRTSLVLLAVFFVFAGFMHFLKTPMYLEIMPPWLGHPRELVYISGVFEIIGGMGIFIPRLRKPAGIGLIALLIAVFPANIHMALNSEKFVNFPVLVLWLRLPLQFVLIAWVWWSTIKD